MDEKKVFKPIDEMLADPWQVDIQELFEASFNEPDEIVNYSGNKFPGF